MDRRTLIAAACALTVAAAASAPAQDYPTQNIKMIISFGPGGGSDIIGRIVAQRMQEKLGQTVVVENRAGAGGMLGNEAVANSPKDGYTLGVMTAGQIIAPVMTKAPRYDTLKVFNSVGQIATAGLLIVTRPDSPDKDIKSLVEAAKANPGKINFASPGYGATQHLAAELFKQVAGVNAQQVQFRTSPEALAALLSKQRGRAVRHRDVAARPGPVRTGARARRHRQGPLPGHAERAGGDRVRRACRVTTSPPGTACSGPKGMPQGRSSPSSTRRSTRSCRSPRFASA